MIRFQRLTGVSMADAAPAPVIPITPEGQAMASIPGWAILLDPGHVVGATIRNRCRANTFVTPASLPLGTLGGNPVFLPTAENGMRANSASVGINATAWTVFAVALPVAAASFQRVIGNQSSDAEPPDVVTPRIGFGTNALAAQIGGSGSGGTRLTYTGNFANRSGLSLVMWTSSTRDGLRIFDNGTLAAANAGDKAALTASFAPGQIDLLRFCRGTYGMVGVLDIDLGWSEHAGYRRRIEDFMFAKYAITP
jgi:hypothetical protein